MEKIFKCPRQTLLNWLVAKGYAASQEGMLAYLASRGGTTGFLGDRLNIVLTHHSGDVNQKLTEHLISVTGVASRGASDQAFFANSSNNLN
jgi:hypothetical protein